MTLPNFPTPTAVGQQFTVGSTTYECTVLPSGSTKAVWKIVNQADKSLRADLADANSTVSVAGVQAKDLANKCNLIYSGSGSPEGVVSAVVGSIYLNKSGNTNTTLYIKESGTGNTGWVAK